MTRSKHLIAINAQMDPEASGGVATFLGALISALGDMHTSEDTYLIVGNPKNVDWLEAIIGDNQTILLKDDFSRDQTNTYGAEKGSYLRKLVAPALRPIKRAIQNELLLNQSAQPSYTFPVSVPVSDGFWEGLNCEVIHFPYQEHVVCGKPTVYNPHDLQHLHYPEFFDAENIAWRESIYPTGCHFAHTIVTASQWVKDDIVHKYGTDPAKIQVIPWAPPTQFYVRGGEHELQLLSENLELPEHFVFYPAITWPHKNHLRLLQAIALLRDRYSLKVHLICTGSHTNADNAYQQILDNFIRDNDLIGQVQFKGYLPEEQLRGVYRLCNAVVVPTLFEAASGPVFEGWQEGKPVACSTVTSLPEQAGDAALLFDPYSAHSIAEAIKSLTENYNLCQKLVANGKQRLNDFQWDRTARAYRAVYRRAAHRVLTKEDETLLSWDWMRHPKRDKDD